MTDIVSTEDKIIALKKQYIISLGDKFTEISLLWQSIIETGKISDTALETALHKIAGSAGMYDEPELGTTARFLEIKISDAEKQINDDFISEINSCLTQLKTIINHLNNE